MTIKWAIHFTAMALIAAQAGRPPVDQPEAQVKMEPRQRESSTRSIAGNATWYDYNRAQAAAGPRLRKWLGKDWRGQTVRVCHGERCTTVTLTDWCLCSRGNRVIDLDVGSFMRLAPASRGVIRVVLTR